jgi:hypothetical protein
MQRSLQLEKALLRGKGYNLLDWEEDVVNHKGVKMQPTDVRIEEQTR